MIINLKEWLFSNDIDTLTDKSQNKARDFRIMFKDEARLETLKQVVVDEVVPPDLIRKKGKKASNAK